jgi:hypothetical protein
VPTGVTSVDVLVVGGGSGGSGGSFDDEGASGNGGNGGGVGGLKSLMVSPGNNVVILVGDGGSGGAGGELLTINGSQGSAGGNSSFDDFNIIGGGNFGGGFSGVDTTDILTGVPVSYSTGGGGGSYLNVPSVNAPPNTGNGGMGGNSPVGYAGFAGGNGGSGIVVVRYVIPPSTTPQNITFPELSDALLGDNSISVNAVSSSGLNVVYESTTKSVCTIFEGYYNGPPTPYPVTLLSVGICSIMASQEGDDTYAEAENVTRSFKVIAAVKNNNAAIADAAEAARKQRELLEILSLVPNIAGLAVNIGDLTNSLLLPPKSSSAKQKCVKGTKTKYVKKGTKCPTGYSKKK